MASRLWTGTFAAGTWAWTAALFSMIAGGARNFRAVLAFGTTMLIGKAAELAGPHTACRQAQRASAPLLCVLHCRLRGVTAPATLAAGGDSGTLLRSTK